MKSPKENLLVFELDNCQAEYAYCLQIIKLCEAKETPSIDMLGELRPFLSKDKLLLSEVMQRGALRYLEEPILLKGQSREEAEDEFYENICRRRVLGEDEFVSYLSLLQGKKQTLHYHIRIHAGWHDKTEQADQLTNFQYLALLLRKLEAEGFFQKRTKKEASVFLIPGDCDRYPFKDDSSTKGIIDEFQDVVSQYLRMIAKKYTGVIYCANLSENGSVYVRALDLKESLSMEKYFPLIPVNASMYDHLFSKSKSLDFYKRLFQAETSFGEASNEKPDVAIPDFVALSAMKRINAVVEEPDSSIMSLIEETGGASILKFCIFAFLLDNANKAETVWKFAEEIEGGVRQVVQNAVQYSQYQECMFSFYLREEEGGDNKVEKSLSARYPGFLFTGKETRKAALEVLISDLNDQSDMIKSFRRNLECDSEMFPEGTNEAYYGHYELRDHPEKIYIRNFFSEFEDTDMKDAWRDFRAKDIVSHVGLSLLALTADRCGAVIRVTSCSEYWPEEKNCFYKVFSRTDQLEGFSRKKRIIPGTQFSLLIPVGGRLQIQETSIGQMDVQEYIREDYANFAKYLDYREKGLLISREEAVRVIAEEEVFAKSSGMTVREEKNSAIIRWLHFWENALPIHNAYEENVVYRVDLTDMLNIGYFQYRDTAEVCIKGFMVAISQLDGINKPVHLALVNLPSGFIELFCDIAVLVGVRNIPGKIQLYLQEKYSDKENQKSELVFTGANFAQSFCRACILAMEHGTSGGFFGDYRKATALYNRLMPDGSDLWENGAEYAVVCPFDVILQIEEDTETTFFEKKIYDMAERELDGKSKGYKLSETHMRLGSKVHIESFYEMSFLFYRTYIANRIAFLILKNLRETSESGFDITKDPVIFFGYASYSKAILTSLSEILRIYRIESGNADSERLVSIASYQHNLQSETSDIQMYFELDGDAMGCVTDDNMLDLRETANIVQVVPISSTLTTFAKMWSEFTAHILPEKRESSVILQKNYTLFWVIDKNNKENGFEPSKIEEKYWSGVEEKKVMTNFRNLARGGCREICFFMCSPVVWNNPLQCNLCFPKNVSEEIPLVETDATSTVPALQIRYMTDKHISDKTTEEFQKSLERLKKLRGCIRQGHIVRRRNHFQYYIDTQKYFRNVRGDISRWLQEEIPKIKNVERSDFPILHIIFSPEHNTNVGFAQYVNTYYFGGLAEIVSVNIDKEFRSNFVCEHAALMNMIASLHRLDTEQNEHRVHFYFVDDSITSGETFEKANSLLHSLLPDDKKQCYPSNLFEKVFLLIDRLSMDSRRMYVENMEENFHSYVHVDVSNMRTQGDSCVGCKLRKGAEQMFMRSATRHQAEYWAGKLIEYRQIPFDDIDELKKIDRDDSYRSMMVYHMLQNVVIKDGHAYTVGETYDTLLDILESFTSDEKVGNLYGYETLFRGMDSMSCVKSVLEIICRPFFSYDYKIKLQVLTFYIFMTESLFDISAEDIFPTSEEDRSRKDFMYAGNRKNRTEKFVSQLRKQFTLISDKFEFIEECLLEGLAEMGSTYLMRKDTMQKAYDCIRKSGDFLEDERNRFWEKYAECIHRILSNTRDETKEHWLEYLFTYGEECPKEKEQDVALASVERTEFPALYTAVTEMKDDTDDGYGFRRFVLELFLQNTGVKFAGADKLAHAAGQITDEYFMDSWNEMRRMEQMATGNHRKENEATIDSTLFRFLEKKKKSGSEEGDKVTEWYRKFLKMVADDAEKNYGLEAKTTQRFLITDNSRRENRESRIPELNIISEQTEADGREKQMARYMAKERLDQALCAENGRKSSLEEYGYYLCDNDRGNYFILFFDNPTGNENSVKQGYNLTRVFLYMSFKNPERKPVGLRYVMRDILAYRHRILAILGQDFNGDTFSNYAKSNDERNILSHEKAASHSASTDDAISTELFVRETIERIKGKKVYRILQDNQMAYCDKAYWLLIRNYTNNQIARLFNRSFRNDESGEIPPLYIESSFADGRKGVFGEKLTKFADLNFTNTGGMQDRRFEMLAYVMDFVVDISDDVEFVHDDKNRYYNLEYFRCILIDSMISAIKYQTTVKDDYLLRIENLLKSKEFSRGEHVGIRFCQQKSENPEVDYLVIENSVDRLACGLSDFKEKNKEIQRKLKDPLDFIDGHMSMLTTKRYVENLGATDMECRFYYEARSESDGSEKLYFISCLPVLNGKER